jgi:hypothetical protein
MMNPPAQRLDTTPTAISIPSGQQVYTHATPDGRTCQSAWAQQTCSCGAYALTWETTAVARSGPQARVLDGTLVPGRPEMTSAPPSRIFDLLPDNQGVIEILAAAIEGPYRFAHNALSPYVTVGPSTRGEPITIHPTARLQLKSGSRPSWLRSVEDTMTFAVMLDQPEERLVEVGSKALPTRRQPAARQIPPQVPLPQSMAMPPAPRKTPPPRLVVGPETPAAKGPPAVDAPIPEILKAVCEAEDVQHDVGDYLVIPTESVPAAEP